MTTPLLLVGVGLVVFGAIVLIRFSDRPGGSLKWMGMEISSKGAGLPLIALGIAAIAFTATRPSGPEPERVPEADGGGQAVLPATDAPRALPACLAAVGGSLPADRVATIEAGMPSLAVVAPPQPLDRPVALVLTENGAPVGAVRLRLYPGSDASSHLFKVEEALDASCQPAPLRNASRGGDPRTLVNWYTLRLRLGAHDYDLRVGAEERMEAGFTRAA